ncbi:MAG TPA: YceI family protein [Gemmatimonadales bacterium]|nr:YceI family protein [Gemmatimonadales bacterium]
MHTNLRATCLLNVLVLCGLGTAAAAQQPDPYGARRTIADSAASPALVPAIDSGLEARDSVVYRLAGSSHLQVKTGKAGLFGFAGHAHTIEARGFAGEVVYYPARPSSSHLEITVSSDSLEVLTPPDTAEIRKVTESMRTSVLRTAEYPEIRLVSRQVTPSPDGFHIVAALTLTGQTREVPIDVVARVGLDTLEAATMFSIKQSDFGIKPFSGGPGGTVKVADRVTFDIKAVAIRVEDAQAHAQLEGGDHARRTY